LDDEDEYGAVDGDDELLDAADGVDGRRISSALDYMSKELPIETPAVTGPPPATSEADIVSMDTGD